MVTRFGMSDSLGAMVYVDTEQDGMFGKLSSKTVSEATQQKVDAEIRRIIDEQYALAPARREPRQGRSDDQRADGVGNHRRRPDQRHHGRPPPRPPRGAQGPNSGGNTPLAAPRWHRPMHPQRRADETV
jgi:cell division protease FtsH